jgi:hypothetical protein
MYYFWAPNYAEQRVSHDLLYARRYLIEAKAQKRMGSFYDFGGLVETDEMVAQSEDADRKPSLESMLAEKSKEPRSSDEGKVFF